MQNLNEYRLTKVEDKMSTYEKDIQEIKDRLAKIDTKLSFWDFVWKAAIGVLITLFVQWLSPFYTGQLKAPAPVQTQVQTK